MKAIDLFSGLGGWSTGARQAGVSVVWAANHWPDAVEWHSQHRLTVHLAGNAVPPLAGQRIIESVLEAA